MQEINREILPPPSVTIAPARSSALSTDGESCVFGPDSLVMDGVRVQREQIAAGSQQYSAVPFLFVGVQDGPAVKMTNERRGKSRSRLFVPGDVEISPPGISCGVWTLKRSTYWLNLGIDSQVISRIAESAGIDSRRIDFVEQVGSQDTTLHYIARRLLREQQSSSLAGGLYTEALVTELVVHLLRKYSSEGIREKDIRGRVDADQLRAALEMIHDEPQANFSLKKLAAAVRLSPYHFSRAFKRVTGLPPHQYVLSHRVQLAKRLLADTSLSIAEVAYQLGFYDQSHFTYHFKRLIGVTPSSLRDSKNFLT
jgi:AraC family transcriptional regulator